MVAEDGTLMLTSSFVVERRTLKMNGVSTMAADGGGLVCLGWSSEGAEGAPASVTGGLRQYGGMTYLFPNSS